LEYGGEGGAKGVFLGGDAVLRNLTGVTGS